MASINRITLIGNLGRDPERLLTSNGIPYAKLSVATHERYQDRKGEWQKSTEWHLVKVWGGSVDRAMQQLRKGSSVYIEGALRSYELDQGSAGFGGRRTRLWEVRAQTWRCLDPRERQDDRVAHEGAQNPDAPATSSPWNTHKVSWDNQLTSQDSTNSDAPIPF